MIMKHTFPFTLALLAAIGCSREIASDTGSSNSTEEGDKILISLTATRAAISSDAEGSAKAAVGETGAVSWEVGDQLKLITENGDVIITEKLEEGGESATFTASISAGDVLKWAVYPANAEANLSDGKLQVTIPAVQDGSFKNASISAGEISEENASVTMKNICCLLRFTVPEAIRATRKVYFGGNGRPMNGKISVNSANLQNEYVNEEDVSNKGIRVEVDINGAGTYYAAVLPNAFDGLTMQTYDGEGKVLSENISYARIPAKRSVIKEIGELRTSKFGTKRFVTENGGGGDQDGKSWETAWSFTTLQSKLQSQKFENVVILVTGGTITPSNTILTLASDTNFKLFGGYPTGLTGEDITSRDFRTNETIFSGKGSANTDRRLFNYQGTTSATLMDGVTLSNTYQKAADDQYSGTCVLVGVSATAYFVNCTFRDNRKDGNAIIRGGNDGGSATVKLTFDRCTFKNNTISGRGILNCKKGCTMKIIDCDFTEGNVVSGETNEDLKAQGKYRVAYKTGGVLEFSGDNKFAANQVSTK